MADGASELVIWERGTAYLADDPVFGPLVRSVGPVTVTASDEPPFVYLARAIIYQQLAGAAARTIHGRFVKAVRGEVTPDRVLRARESTLRKAGLSAAKTRAVRDLARVIRDGEVDVSDLPEQSNEEIVRRLTTVWGIGVWTVEMYLMFRLHRPDVWPVGDLGVRAGYARLHALDATPGAKDMDPLGEAYRPWRSAAAWYCWRALEIELPDA